MINKQFTVFITGASSGIGEGCAHAFAKRGDKLILAARRIERLEKLSTELKKKYSIECLPLKLDVSDRSAVENVIGSLPSAFCDVDVLMNNAGGAHGLESIANGNPDDWDKMIDSNVKGLLWVTRAILPNMLKRNIGHIINIGSIAGRMVYPNGSVYCGAKFAERAVTQGLMMELVNTPIRVTTIDPGLVETEFSLVRFKGDKERADQVYQGFTPLTALDIADSVVFCATRPAHVNISELVILPTDQASPYHVNKI